MYENSVIGRISQMPHYTLAMKPGMSVKKDIEYSLWKRTLPGWKPQCENDFTQSREETIRAFQANLVPFDATGILGALPLSITALILTLAVGLCSGSGKGAEGFLFGIVLGILFGAGFLCSSFINVWYLSD